MATLTSRLIVSMTDRVSGPARGIGAALAHLRRQGERTSGALIGGGAGMMGGTVRNMLAIGAGYVGVSKAIGGTVGEAIKFESAFSDVRKVVDGTPAQLQEVRSQIIAMSKEVPLSAVAISELFAAAGESGVAINELKAFSDMAARVGIAFDMSAGEAGDSLAKLKAQLGLNVEETGLMADAINHLSNSMASKASQVTAFMLRVGKFAEMGGFHRDQVAAFGSAMISAGAEAETAGTAMMNVVRKMTTGEFAKKDQRQAARALGLDLPTLAKQMKKDAPKAVKTVLKAIAKAPEEKQIALLSKFFGDEARAFSPLVGNIKLLDDALESVADRTKYAGSAQNEYLERAKTTANALQLIGNKIKAVGIGIGDSWLPTIKDLGGGIGDVLDTLDKRVGILDEVKAAFSGFLTGVGYGGTGGLREMVNDLGDVLFGKAFEGQLRDADERVTGLANISNRFRSIGRDLKAFSEDIRAGKIGDALGSLGEALGNMGGGLTVGSALAVGVVGWGLLKIASGATALAASPIGIIAVTATGVAALIEATKGADSIGEFADNLSKLSAIELGSIAATLGIAGYYVWRLVRGMRALGAAREGAAGTKPGVEKSPDVRASPPKPSEPGSGLNSKPSKGFQSPWNRGAPSERVPSIPRGPTGTPISRPPVPAPIMDLPSLPAPGGFGAALKDFFGKGGLIATGILAAGEGLINDMFRAAGINPDTSNIMNDLAEKQRLGLSFSEFQKRRAGEEDNASSLMGLPSTILKTLQSVDAWLTSQFPSMRANVGGPSDVSVVGIPEVSIPSPVTVQPAGVQDVRVTNPPPAPNFNITINAPSSDPQAIAGAVESALSRKWQALGGGAYSDGAN